jgi:RimJ/RimL family protein N-acetyltransferase
VVARARELGCRRIWLVTTNDNTRALQFYQRQGWDVVALHRDAVTAARRIKPPSRRPVRTASRSGTSWSWRWSSTVERDSGAPVVAVVRSVP